MIKRILIIVGLVIGILAIGIVGQADYEYETIELTHTSKARMPYWYEN